jgi:hypothetical protein
MDAIDKFAKSRYPLLGMQLEDILIFGHTHKPYIDYENNVINTGSWISDMLVPKWFEEEYEQDKACSGWDYPPLLLRRVEDGQSFLPHDKETKRLHYYSQFFETTEMDSTFYNRFYSKMTKGTFIGMTKATPERLQFIIKVLETMIHEKD